MFGHISANPILTFLSRFTWLLVELFNRLALLQGGLENLFHTIDVSHVEATYNLVERLDYIGDIDGEQRGLITFHVLVQFGREITLGLFEPFLLLSTL